MRLTEAASQTYARHETFHPRYGWFRKAYAFASLDPHVFMYDDAPVIVGVGKNMVRAIRFWGTAAKVITKDPSTNSRKAGVVPTGIGYSFFDPEQGWDPYMEDPGTLWILHWLLLAPTSHLPIWWLAFNDFHAVEFDDDILLAAVGAGLEGTSEWNTPHDSSIKKDVGALLRTYAPAERKPRAGLDDVLDCPLRELRLIDRSRATGNYRFNIGKKPSLPPAVATFCVLDYLMRRGVTGNTVTLAQLASESGGPGRILKLTESNIHSLLESGVESTRGLALLSPNGAHQLSWSRPLSVVAKDVLNNYYDHTPLHATVGPEGDRPLAPDLLPDRSQAMLRIEAVASNSSIGVPA